ncbi:MAG: hypothetical protein JRD89_05990, partial [Deltaproteobacteria bacterium]|nr:hypothetical protein [Deltaproteobacteria bacterium]
STATAAAKGAAKAAAAGGTAAGAGAATGGLAALAANPLLLPAAVIAGAAIGPPEAARALDKAAKPLLEPILKPLAGIVKTVATPIIEGAKWLVGGIGNLLGFQEGAVFNQPTILPAHTVAEAGYTEAYLPLSPDVFGKIGQGIVSALTPAQPLAAEGSIQVDMRGLYDGATINVRDDQDIKQIARETYTLYRDRMRAQGRHV